LLLSLVSLVLVRWPASARLIVTPVRRPYITRHG
jgi:hypothetical protein